MPLASYKAPTYIRCDRLFVNTEDKNRVRSKSNFDVIVELDQLYEKVIAIELSTYNIPFDISPMFSDGSDGRIQNNLLDVRFTTLATAGGHPATVTINVDLSNRGFGTFQEVAEFLTDEIESELLLAGVAPFDPLHAVEPFNMDITVVQGCKLSFNAQFTNTGAPIVQPSAQVEFLFTTGPGVGFTPWTVLGFPSDADTILSAIPLINFPYSVLPLQLSLERWVDVIVEQASELDPVSRVPISGEDYDTDRFNVTKPRLLTKPIRNMQEIRVRLAMQDGNEPTSVSTNGFDFVFDLLVISPEQCIPSWIQQELQYK